MNKTNKSPQEIADEAERLFLEGNLEKAADKYIQLAKNASVAPLAYYKLAELSNMIGDALKAKELYHKAFELKPDICAKMLAPNHPNNNYVFKGFMEEQSFKDCPLCGRQGYPYWCYCVMENTTDYMQQFNPVRVWMRCDECCHLFAMDFPEQKMKRLTPRELERLARKNRDVGVPAKPHLFPYYSEIFSRISKIASGGGVDLLEVGVGGCACSLVAVELGYKVLAIDIAGECVAQALKYGIDAEQHDFMQFEPARTWGVIVCGDVIEHVHDPGGF